MKVLKGFCYSVTALTDSTISDSNGLSLSVKAGEQAYFIASTDQVTVSGNCKIVQTRGNFNVPTSTSGGGGLVFAPGDVVLFGDDNCSVVIANLNEDANPLIGLGSPLNENIDIPEGVTFKNLQSSFYEDGFGNSVGLFSGAVNQWHLPLSTNLKNLKNGTGMFAGTGLGSFSFDLPVLENGTSMFHNCMALLQFNADMPFLTLGNEMFSDCVNLELFHGFTGSLQDGTLMFNGCTSLEYFEGDLRSLTNGYAMFSGCKLKLPALQQIANTIKNVSGSGHSITIGYNSNQVTDVQKQNVETILNGKGWNVVWEEN